MSYKPSYSSGQWLALCDICGKKFKANELRQRWDGFMVDDACFEHRHPQDFVRGIADFQIPYWTRPEPEDTFVGVCTPNGCTAIVDYAVVDCARVDFVSVIFDRTVNPPACNALYYFTDTTIPAGDFLWACGSLVLDDNDEALVIDDDDSTLENVTLTIEGTIGIN